MLSALFLAIHLVFPLLLVFWLWNRTHRSRTEQVLHALFTAAALMLLWFWGQWPVVGSYHLRWLLPALFLAAALAAIKRWQSTPRNRARGSRVLPGVFLVLLGLFGALDVFAIRGHFLPQQGVELGFPLRDGTYYVSSGGDSAVLNVHFKPAFPTMRYAIDVSKLGEFGQSANGLFPAELERHLIFDEPVYSPCAGQVVAADDGSDDHPAGFLDPGAERTPANQVGIECGAVTVYLTHLKNGSVAVTEGDPVEAGQMIGRVGNSGYSEEPHLHIQAVRAMPGDPEQRVAVPMTFSGRFLVRNSRLHAN